MVLDTQRRRIDFLILPLARLLRGFKPNEITFIGLLFVLPAAALLWRATPAKEGSNYYLVFAALLVVIHGLLDLVDGVLARTYHGATPMGDFFDHVVDRVSDILLLAAVSFSPWGDVRIGFVAVAATLLTSYLGTQAQAVGAGRMYSGFVARADRVVLLMVAPLVDHVLAANGQTLGHGLPPYVLGLVLWYIAIGGIITALERFVRIHLFLRRAARSK